MALLSLSRSVKPKTVKYLKYSKVACVAVVLFSKDNSHTIPKIGMQYIVIAKKTGPT